MILRLITAFLALTGAAEAASPRIVNIYNFIRDNDFRLANSETILFEATREQVRLLNELHLPATFALQYDALIDTNYQALLKNASNTNFEMAAWWEIPETLAKRAGLPWRGEHEWDPAADVGFSPGYTPEERRRLVDAYMADFKRIFGYYPKSAGSWYLDEVTLAYMADKYGIVASCNCKDQVGTDGYTLWGGYWNQAYYPSKLNAYMPAQTEAGQIGAPIFRMLGSDPIYQHGTTPGLISLEPVYHHGGGGSESWVRWFMNGMIDEPTLAFGWTQAGQENSFGWEAMKAGIEQQFALFAEERKAGLIQVETLAEAGQWFREKFKVTPPTAVVALDDWKHEGRRTVWYDSRFYRLNLLWQSNGLFIRDIHLFDESVVSPTHETALKGHSLAYQTLPIVDSAQWAESKRYPALLALEANGMTAVVSGEPIVKESGAKSLRIEQGLSGGGKLSIVCEESKVECKAPGLREWGWRLSGRHQAPIEAVKADGIDYRFDGVNYKLQLTAGSCAEAGNGDILLRPDRSGRIILTLDQRRRAGPKK